MAHDYSPGHPLAVSLARLAALLQAEPLEIVDALEQARECGAEAFRAGERLERIVALASDLVPERDYPLREFPAAVVEATLTGFLRVSQEQRLDLMKRIPRLR